MSYDQDRLRLELGDALGKFIGADVLPIGRKAVIDGVTETAFYLLKTICGDPDTPTPRGLLGFPVVEHRRCNDASCLMCTRGQDIVFGRPE